MNVLSLFDGCSGGRLSLVRADKKIDKYYTCEIDKYSSMVTKLNFPDTIALGDITKVNFEMLPKIDFLIGGSPCQDLSFAKGNGKGLEGERSGLFYKYFEALEVLRKKNPEIKFLLENVKMKQEWKDIISDKLGVQPIFINSADFSAQNRQRLYWTNIPVDEWIPCEDKLQDILEQGEALKTKSQTIPATLYKENVKSMLKRNKKGLLVGEWFVNRDKAYPITATYSGACPRDYFEKSQRQLVFTDREKSHCIDANYFKGGNLKSYFEKHRRQLVFTNPASIVGRRIDKRGKRQDYDVTVPKVQTLEVHEKDKSRCISTVAKDSLVSPLPEGRYEANPIYWRKLTVLEVERLQTVPERYTKCGQKETGEIVEISNTQRYKMLGNGFTINVIAHIIKNL